MHLIDGQPATVAVPMLAAGQSGMLDVQVRTSDFASLASAVSPTARFSGATVAVSAAPHSAQYPEEPTDSARSLFLFTTNNNSDVQLVTSYGQFLGEPWKEVRTTTFYFNRTDPIAAGYIVVREPVQSAAAVVMPILGPPTQPQINGIDASAPVEVGVGLEPTLSWSPPSLGSPSSYQVTITMDPYSVNAGDVVELSAIVDGTSFKIPAGFLLSRHAYSATISARQAPWDGPTRLPLRTGSPLYTADCLIPGFTP